MTIPYDEIGTLAMALHRYGGHTRECRHLLETNNPCDCGWWETVAHCGEIVQVEEVEKNAARQERIKSALHLLCFNLRTAWPPTVDKMGYLPVMLYFHPQSSMGGSLAEVFASVGLDAPVFLGSDEKTPIAHGKEVDYGVNWVPVDSCRRYRLSWDEKSGEVFFFGLNEDVVGNREVLGVVPSKEILDSALDGWTEKIHEEDGMAWVRQQVAYYSDGDAWESLRPLGLRPITPDEIAATDNDPDMFWTVHYFSNPDKPEELGTLIFDSYAPADTFAKGANSTVNLEHRAQLEASGFELPPKAEPANA